MRHAATPATRALAFPADETLDARGRVDASALTRALPGGTGSRVELLCSPAARARQTAEAAGLSGAVADSRLAEADFGSWAGRTLAELQAQDPAAVAAWMTDADAAPHGGESLTAFSARVGGWLDEQATREGRAVAITHGGVIKAAVVRALGAPVSSFWRVDVAPLSVTTLHAHGGRWTVAATNVPTCSVPVGPATTGAGQAGSDAPGAVA